MTPQQIDHVQTGFRPILPIRVQAEGPFHDRFFGIDPSVQPLFAHISLDAGAVDQRVRHAPAGAVGDLDGQPLLAPAGLFDRSSRVRVGLSTCFR